MKRLVKHTFHSSLLIPKKVVDEAKTQETKEGTLEVVLLWMDTHQSNHFMRSGDEVFHKDNFDQLIHVDRIIRKTYGDEKDKRQKIVGVEVHFWEEFPEEEFV